MTAPASATLSIPKLEAPWMPIMLDRQKRGVHELKGKAHNAEILTYARDIGITWMKTDDSGDPWCATCAGSALELSGYQSTRKAYARSYTEASYLKLGAKKLAKPIPGCIAIWPRGKPGSGQGHINFVVEVQGNRLKCVGGNQEDEVYGSGGAVTFSYPRWGQSQEVGFYWPAPRQSAPPAAVAAPAASQPPPLAAPAPGATAAEAAALADLPVQASVRTPGVMGFLGVILSAILTFVQSVADWAVGWSDWLFSVGPAAISEAVEKTSPLQDFGQLLGKSVAGIVAVLAVWLIVSAMLRKSSNRNQTTPPAALPAAA